MKKLILPLLILSLLIPTALAISDNDIALVVDKLNTIDSEIMHQTCKYDSGANAIELQIFYDIDSHVLAVSIESNLQMKTDLENLILKTGTTIRSTLDQLNGKDVAVIISLITKDNIPIYLNINGIDASWLLSQ